MLSLFTTIAGSVLSSLFLVYSVWVLLHLVVQTLLAHLYWRRTQRQQAYEGPWPSVTVVIPSYNEGADELRLCFDAVIAQDYPGRIDVHVVDDFSPNRDEVLPVLEEYGRRDGWRVHLPAENKGKRLAQDVAIRDSVGDMVLTIDSDTQLAPDAVRHMVAALADERVGAATGDVRVSNSGTNLLTRLIDLRYWVAFNQERAAHAYYGAVLCCSGPLSIYRREVVDAIWGRYVAQTFRGIECTYGDDRHLTNLVLSEGHRTVFVPDARCITSAPTTLRQYLRQQLRWNKSYYRELLWTLSFLPRLGRYMWFEVITQTMLPMLLALAVVATGVRAAIHGPSVLALYAAIVAVMAVAHCLYAVWRQRNAGFFLFVVYGFLHALLLIPLRLRAIGSLTDNSWGTRGAPKAAPVATPAPLVSPVPVTLELVEIGAPAKELADASAVPSGRQTVLVVDDDRDVLDLVTRKLKQSGYDVVTAQDGLAALTVVAERKPDLMLLDVMMPGMSGVEVCRTLRADQGEGAPPVIFLSAKSQEADIEAGMAAGAEDYVVKPFSPRDLVARTEAVLARAA